MKKSFRIAGLIVLSVMLAFTAVGITGTNFIDVYAAVYKQGSTGATVKTIQQKLKNWGYYTGAVDGIFGAKTKAAVQYFQRKNGLTADGIVGAKTLAALGMSSSSAATSSYSDSDVNLLARLIYGEARGESYVGQVAVGAVVMNRIKSSSFPNTMAGVIYQSYAFTAVSDGQINLTPDATAKKAAQDAMNGWDPTYGAIYYYNPKTATSQWIFSRQTTITIGNHVFAK
ncbi:MAG: spore cortex-lytic enzyme [Clostridia bacterium]|nr:spore cortex-lytic enzyme [Clostridia bacterium]